ncbi:hypothetical protein BJ741DRAFT_707861 [Chytriomyces cf. hyalinus JEL632]|nr:hypothetical protein BJ741DRAFT_707861 [Chytriomyces cf. hyalinus JEL632]
MKRTFSATRSPNPVLLKAWMRVNECPAEWRVPFRHVTYVDSQADSYADITFPSLGVTLFCMNNDSAKNMSEAALRGLVHRLCNHPVNTLPNTRPYSNTLPLLAFQRAMDAAYKTVQQEFAETGQGVICRVELIPVCSVESTAQAVDLFCQRAQEESGLNSSGHSDAGQNVAEDMRRMINQSILSGEASLSILSLLSGRPAPLSRQSCLLLKSSFQTIASIAQASRSDLVRGTRDPVVSAQVKQFFEEESL